MTNPLDPMPAIEQASTRVLRDLIQQISTILVPAIAEAAKGALSGVTVTIGPITIEPIQIRVEL